MNSRTIFLALLAATVLAGGARAQGFGSISSQPVPVAPAAQPTPVQTTPVQVAPEAIAPEAAASEATATGTTGPSATTPVLAAPVPATPEPAATATVPGASPSFSSVSSLPATAVTALPTTPEPANLEPAATPTTAATAAPALAFSSVSSLSGSGGSGTGSGPSLPSRTAGFEMADRILVEKGARRLYLLNRGNVIAEYPVKLGLSPKGHKQYEGDFRTPEGVYYLSRRNPRSEFFLSVEISYPNEMDRALARQEGLRPGGLIMIHGQPNVPRRPSDYYARMDWTDGCIAVSNADMVQIWQRTRIGIPIEIRP